MVKQLAKKKETNKNSNSIYETNISTELNTFNKYSNGITVSYRRTLGCSREELIKDLISIKQWLVQSSDELMYSRLIKLVFPDIRRRPQKQNRHIHSAIFKTLLNIMFFKNAEISDDIAPLRASYVRKVPLIAAAMLYGMFIGLGNISETGRFTKGSSKKLDFSYKLPKYIRENMGNEVILYNGRIEYDPAKAIYLGVNYSYVEGKKDMPERKGVPPILITLIKNYKEMLKYVQEHETELRNKIKNRLKQQDSIMEK